MVGRGLGVDLCRPGSGRQGAVHICLSVRVKQARHARSVEECVTAMTQDQVALHKEVRPSLIPQEVFTRSAVTLTVSATRVSHCASLTASLSLSCGALQARTLDGACGGGTAAVCGGPPPRSAPRHTHIRLVARHPLATGPPAASAFRAPRRAGGGARAQLV